MNESSEVKAFAGNASNLSGRSIKRKLQRRNPPALIALGSILWVSNQSRCDEDYYRWRSNNHMHPSDPSAYGLRHDRKVSLSKLGRSYCQPISFRMAKTLCITQPEEIKRETVRLADEPVVAMMGMDNITYLSKGALDASGLVKCVRRTAVTNAQQKKGILRKGYREAWSNLKIQVNIMRLICMREWRLSIDIMMEGLYRAEMRLHLKPYWGKPNVRNFRELAGNMRV